MTKTDLIDNIMVYTTEYAFKSGKFRRFKIETKMTEDGAWKVGGGC